MSEPASADAAAPPPADPTPTEPPPPPVNPEEERRQKVLADYRKVLLQHKETEAKVKQSASRAPFPSFAPAGKKCALTAARAPSTRSARGDQDAQKGL